MCYALLLHPLLHHAFMLLLPVVSKPNFRLSDMLKQSLKAFKDQYPKRTEMLGTAPASAPADAPCPSKRQTLSYHARLLSLGAPSRSQRKENTKLPRKQTFRQKNLGVYHYFSHLKLLPAVDLHALQLIRTAINSMSL